MQLALGQKWLRQWVAQHPWVLEAGGLWLAQHVVIVGMVALYQRLLPGIATVSYGRYGHTILEPFGVWDASLYSHIAQFGYDISRAGAFPPLFPLLEALLAPLCGSAVLAGILIANLTGLGACLLLRWVLDPVIGARVSQRTLFFMLCFPTSMFFLAAYTESLYLLLSLAVFAALQRRAFWWAGGFAGLAIMTRYTGAFLVFPLLIGLYQARAVWWRYLSAAIAPLLMGGFWLFLIARFHEWPTTSVFRAFYSTFTWPWVGLARSVTYLMTGGHAFAPTQDTARDLILTLILLAMTVFALRANMPLTFKVYTATFVLFVLAVPIMYPNNYDALFSVPRYLLPIFPLFIPLARASLRSKGLHLALFATTLLCSLYLLAGFTAEWLIA